MRYMLTMLIFAIAALSACNRPATAPSVPEPRGECERASKNLRSLGCPFFVDGFAAVCSRTYRGGIDVNATCIAHARTCDEADRCPR